MVKVAAIFILGAGVLALASASPAPRQTPSNDNDIYTNTNPPNFSFEHLFQLQKKFLDNFISPANTAQVNRIPFLRLQTRVPH